MLKDFLKQMGDIFKLLDNSWRIYLKYIFIILPYSLISCGINLILLLLLVCIFTFIPDYGFETLILQSILALIDILLFIFVSTITSYIVAKLYYEFIYGNILNYKTLFKDLKNNLNRLNILNFIISAEFITFIILDITGLIIIFSWNHLVMEDNCLLSVISILTIVSLITLLFLELIFLFLFFPLFYVFQIIFYMIEKISIKALFKDIFNTMKQFLLQNPFFVYALYFYCLVMFFVLCLPLLTLGGILSAFLKENEINYLTSGLTILIFFLPGIFLWPLFIGSITYYFYYIKVNSEGLDLARELKKSHNRKEISNDQ